MYIELPVDVPVRGLKTCVGDGSADKLLRGLPQIKLRGPLQEPGSPGDRKSWAREEKGPCHSSKRPEDHEQGFRGR